MSGYPRQIVQRAAGAETGASAAISPPHASPFFTSLPILLAPTYFPGVTPGALPPAPDLPGDAAPFPVPPAPNPPAARPAEERSPGPAPIPGPAAAPVETPVVPTHTPVVEHIRELAPSAGGLRQDPARSTIPNRASPGQARADAQSAPPAREITPRAAAQVPSLLLSWETGRETAGPESEHPLVRLEPAARPAPPAAFVPPEAPIPGIPAETRRAPDLPPIRTAVPPRHSEAVRVSIGRVDVRVEAPPPAPRPVRAPAAAREPFSTLALARRGWRLPG